MENSTLSDDTIDLDALVGFSVEAHHHYKYSHYRYQDLRSIWWHIFSGRAKRLALIENTRNYLAMKRIRFRKDRIEILSNLVDRHINNNRGTEFLATDRRYSFVESFSDIYGDAVWVHRDKGLELKRFEFIIESLISSGDLEGDSSSFTISAHALETLATHAAEEQRHNDLLWQNKILLGLTAVLAMGALFQILDFFF